jgi:hypothetical protein
MKEAHGICKKSVKFSSARKSFAGAKLFLADSYKIFTNLCQFPDEITLLYKHIKQPRFSVY